MTEPSLSRGRGRHHAFSQLVYARVREFLREPEAVFWVYVFPLVLVVALGVAFRHQGPGEFKVVIVENAGSVNANDVLSEDDRFQVAVTNESEARLQLRTGRADLMIRPLSEGQSDLQFEYSYDPHQPNGLLARNIVDNVLQRAAGRADVFAVQDLEVTEPGGRYIDFLVPGLLGMGLLGGGLWGVGFAIIDLRIRKLLKRYVATPMRRSDFLAAVMVSRLVFTVPEVLIVLLFSRVIFGVTSQGSYLIVALLILMGAFQFAGIGLLVASRAQTLESVSGLMNAVVIPMWIGSGLFFSIERFPEVVQPLLKLLPLTPLIGALRSVMMEGAGLMELGPQIGLILAWGVISFALALRWFRWS
jgi:ABC-type multidrug transport system permease subunit